MNKAKKYKLKLDYTAEELKELKELSKVCDSPMNAIKSPMNAIKQIVKEGVVGDQFGHLREKYLTMEYEDEFNFMADVNNVVMGTAIFPEPKKYYVHLIKGDENSYLNITPVGGLVLGSHLEDNGWKNKFTHEEIISMNPQLLLFEEDVEK